MSFQAQPMMSQPPPEVVVPPKGKRRKGLMIFGLILLIGGVLGGGAIVAKGLSNYKDAVQSMARAPVGCTTTLVFDKPATFTIYAETKGRLGDLGGDCEVRSGEYEHPGDKLPKLSLAMDDPNGEPVDLQRGATAEYDIDGYVGTAVRTVDIEEAGTYHLNVESDESDFAVAIGKDPESDSEKLLQIGGGVALGGFVIGLILFLLGLRRRKSDPAMAGIRNPVAPLPGWPPGPYAGAGPTSPPGPAPIHLPQQPPVRPPEHIPSPGFAPPSMVPPPPPPAPSEIPTLPTMPPAPPSGPPTLPPPGSSWSLPGDDEDESKR